jgi:hypothetical protein
VSEADDIRFNYFCNVSLKFLILTATFIPVKIFGNFPAVRILNFAIIVIFILLFSRIFLLREYSPGKFFF